MNGPAHYREAEELLRIVDDGQAGDTAMTRDELLATAQVHATLALAAATADGSRPADDNERAGMEYGVYEDWRDAIGGRA